jgi:hypothetical protein
MKQTAMQKLKWFVSDGLDCFDESIKVSEIWEKINELLEMEKQQIIDAYRNGKTQQLENSEIYYNETYNK